MDKQTLIDVIMRVDENAKEARVCRDKCREMWRESRKQEDWDDAMWHNARRYAFEQTLDELWGMLKQVVLEEEK